MSEGDGNLCNHKSGLVVGESPYLDEMPEQLSSFDEVHQEEYSLLVFEDVVHTYNKRVFYVVQNFFFKFQGVHLVVLQHHVFSDAFHSINFSWLLVLHLEHLSEGALSYDSHQLKVL